MHVLVVVFLFCTSCIYVFCLNECTYWCWSFLYRVSSSVSCDTILYYTIIIIQRQLVRRRNMAWGTTRAPVLYYSNLYSAKSLCKYMSQNWNCNRTCEDVDISLRDRHVYLVVAWDVWWWTKIWWSKVEVSLLWMNKLSSLKSQNYKQLLHTQLSSCCCWLLRSACSTDNFLHSVWCS